MFYVSSWRLSTSGHWTFMLRQVAEWWLRSNSSQHCNGFIQHGLLTIEMNQKESSVTKEWMVTKWPHRSSSIILNAVYLLFSWVFRNCFDEDSASTHPYELRQRLQAHQKACWDCLNHWHKQLHLSITLEQSQNTQPSSHHLEHHGTCDWPPTHVTSHPKI